MRMKVTIVGYYEADPAHYSQPPATGIEIAEVDEQIDVSEMIEILDTDSVVMTIDEHLHTFKSKSLHGETTLWVCECGASNAGPGPRTLTFGQ
jgi:hypothetical protein